MGNQNTEQHILYATLCEVERGLFHVAYRVEGKGLGHHPLPRYELGTSALDAQSRVEQHARECGYLSVVWECGADGLLLPASGALRDIRLAQ